MRIVATIVLAFIVSAGPANAKNDKVLRAPVPEWAPPSELMSVPDDAAGMAFVRQNDVFVHLDEQGQAILQGYRIKLLHPNALQLGNLSIAWNPAAGAPTVHMVRVHREEEVIDVLKSVSFEILRREDQLEAALLDGVLTAILRVPDLRVGDELEVAWTTRSNNSTLGSNVSGLLTLAPDPAPGRFRLGLSWDDGQKPLLKMTSEMSAAASQQANAISFRFDNPPMQSPPMNAPARYQWQRVVEYSDFPDWTSISRQFAPLYANAAKLQQDSPIRKEASRIAAAHSRQIDRASAALKLVQQEVRYIYVGLDGGNLTPATADETWRRRYGDCKGKTALLLALLAELGIEAEPILVSNAGIDDGLNERLPNPGLFDHVLVRAQLDGKWYWLDGTLPPVAPPSPLPVMPYKWTLPIAALGRSIERLEWRLPERPDEITLHDIDARAGFDRPARITNTLIVRGIEGLKQQVQLSGLSQEQLLIGLRQKLIGDTWQSIDDVRWRYDVASGASILKISGTGKIGWEDDGDGARSLSLPGGGFNPPERRVRATEQDQDAPYYNKPGFSCDVTTVRLPQHTKTEKWSFNSTFDDRLFGRNYYRAFELRDGAIRMVRGSRVEQEEIDAATARQDNARINNFDNSMAKIYYDPAGQDAVKRNRPSVPATDEIDWTADKVPCLGLPPVQIESSTAS